MKNGREITATGNGTLWLFSRERDFLGSALLNVCELNSNFPSKWHPWRVEEGVIQSSFLFSFQRRVGSFLKYVNMQYGSEINIPQCCHCQRKPREEGDKILEMSKIFFRFLRSDFDGVRGISLKVLFAYNFPFCKGHKRRRQPGERAI